MTPNIIYVGVKAHVVAIDKNDGRSLWQTKLKGGLAGGDRFVTLLVEEGRVFAHAYGILFCLDAANGQILWANELEGLGYDIVSLAAEGVASLPSGSGASPKEPGGSGRCGWRYWCG